MIPIDHEVSDNGDPSPAPFAERAIQSFLEKEKSRSLLQSNSLIYARRARVAKPTLYRSNGLSFCTR